MGQNNLLCRHNENGVCCLLNPLLCLRDTSNGHSIHTKMLWYGSASLALFLSYLELSSSLRLLNIHFLFPIEISSDITGWLKAAFLILSFAYLIRLMVFLLTPKLRAMAVQDFPFLHHMQTSNLFGNCQLSPFSSTFKNIHEWSRIQFDYKHMKCLRSTQIKKWPNLRGNFTQTVCKCEIPSFNGHLSLLH